MEDNYNRRKKQSIEGLRLSVFYPHGLTPRSIAILTTLIVAGFVGNYFSLSLLLEMNFLFGGIAVLIVVNLYGPIWGILAALLASSYTYILWDHPLYL